jgi:hypothetical protein
MKLPALLYGTEAEVRKRCRTIEKSIADGATLGEALSETDDVDTRDQPGLIVMEYPGSPLAGQKHFLPYVLPDQIAEGVIKDRIDRKRERSLFDELLERPWGVLALLSMPVGHRWTARHLPWINDLVEAVVRDWQIFAAEGTRYSIGSDEGMRLHQLSTFLGPALHYRGVPEAQLRAHLLSDGLPPLLPYLKRK